MGGLVLRCTAKTLKLLRAGPSDLVTVEHSDQDWYANLLWLDGRKCLLLVHAGTLFSAFVPDIHKADLMPIGPSVVAFIHRELEAERLPLDRFGDLESRSIELAKTESRTVLGYMNEMGRFCDYAVAEYGGLAQCDAASSEGNFTFPGGLPGTSSQLTWPEDHRHETPPSRTGQPSGLSIDHSKLI